jgi:hypothetical protein
MNQNEADVLSPVQSSPNQQEFDTSSTLSDVGSLKSNSTETKYQDQYVFQSSLLPPLAGSRSVLLHSPEIM